MMVVDKYLRDNHGELILTADGSPIPYAAFENEPSDTYLYLYSRSRKERVELMINMGVHVSQRLLDQVKICHEGVDKS
jgi:hypothetical protein